MMKIALVLLMATLARGQRPSFAGSRPIGYPEITSTEGLADRFGEVDGTTQRLPIQANGDKDLIDRLSKLPIDQQPFWFINWQAIEANKPQTYPQKPNQFIDRPQNQPINVPNSGINSVNKNSASAFSATVPNSNSNAPNVANRISETSTNQKTDTASLENRFSGGIAVNKYQETVTSKSEVKGNTVANYNTQYYYSR